MSDFDHLSKARMRLAGFGIAGSEDLFCTDLLVENHGIEFRSGYLVTGILLYMMPPLYTPVAEAKGAQPWQV